jgi:hypothetical protein
MDDFGDVSAARRRLLRLGGSLAAGLGLAACADRGGAAGPEELGSTSEALVGHGGIYINVKALPTLPFHPGDQSLINGREPRLPPVTGSAVGDGDPDNAYADTEAIQWAIDRVSKRGGGTVFLPSGQYMLSQGLELRTHVVLRGEGRGITVLRKAQAFDEPMIWTSYFRALLALENKEDQFNDPRLPRYFGIVDLTIRGRFVRTLRSNDFIDDERGDGVLICGRHYELDCEIRSIGGVGLQSICHGADRKDEAFPDPHGETVHLLPRKDLDWRVEVTECGEQCVILDGPGDGRIHHLWAAFGGMRYLLADEDDGRATRPNIEIREHGAEIGQLHSWASLGGPALVIASQADHKPRVNAGLIIAESARHGCVVIGGGTHGIIDKLVAHYNHGTDGEPDVEIARRGRDRALIISSLLVQGSGNSYDTECSRVRFYRAEGVQLGNVHINGQNRIGHGLELRDADRVSIDNLYIENIPFRSNAGNHDTDPRDLALFHPAAIYREIEASRVLRIRGIVARVPCILATSGHAGCESIDVTFELPDARSRVWRPIESGTYKAWHSTARWDLNGVLGGRDVSTRSASMTTFSSTTAEQPAIRVPHNLFRKPDPARVTPIVRMPESAGNSAMRVARVDVTATDHESVTVRVILAQTTVGNENPKLQILAEL